MGPFTESWTEADVETVLQRGDPQELLYVPILIGMNAPDCGREWVEGICFGLAEHPHFNVRGNAVLALGHIARTCRALNIDEAAPIIAAALRDEHEFVRNHAQSASEDLETYLGVVIKAI